MASNPCKRQRTNLNGDKKRKICVYKDAHPKVTCSDIAAHFAKEWDETVGRTTVGDILRSKEKWMSHERSGRAVKYGKLEETLILWFNEQHPSLSPSHLEQLWSTLRALDTTSTISRKQTCVTDFFQK